MITAKISNDLHSTEIGFPCKKKQLAVKLGQIGIGSDQLFPTGTIEHIEPAELSVLEKQTVSAVLTCGALYRRRTLVCVKRRCENFRICKGKKCDCEAR